MHVKRSGNAVADKLAKLAAKYSHSQVWYDDIPYDVNRAGSTILGALDENFKWILFLTLKSKFVQIKINLLHGSIN